LKQLSLGNKLLYAINIVFAILYLVTLLASFLKVDFIGELAILSLIAPFLATVHIIFFIYWVLAKRWVALLSLTLLILGHFVLGPFYRFSEPSQETGELSLMTFNVRDLNRNEILDIENVDSLIMDFVTRANPDIVCFQEYHGAKSVDGVLGQYPYRYIDFVSGHHDGRVVQGLYSKFPILITGAIDFPNSSNKAIFADVVLAGDTVRIYNIHLQSFNVIPEFNTITDGDSEKLAARVYNGMVKQQQQAEIMYRHMAKSPLKKIVVGDFNNTQYSNIYRKIRGNLNDTFLEKGKGFGTTYKLFGYPMRIDYILADPSFDIISHHNFDLELSDHYPVMATFQWASEP